jgi:hypothetical protein
VTNTAEISTARRSPSGFTLILLATAISGIASYIVTSIVFARLDEGQYALFAGFWSFLYLIVGTLSGVQQEITRGTHPIVAGNGARAGKARNFGLLGASVVVVAVIATSPLWIGAAFGGDGRSLVWPLAVGTGSSVLVAVLCGSLYGISQWMPLAMLMTVDAILRLIAIATVLTITENIIALAWAVALPFPGAIVVLWIFIRRSIVGRSQLDASYRTVTWNASRTMIAAAATGIMVSGFPFILRLTADGEPAGLVGLYVFCITLARAPLIVVAMSLQSYLIINFRDRISGFWQFFLRIQAAVFGAGVVLAGAAWLLGPAIFGWLFADKQVPSGGFLAVLVLSSALVGSMCVSAPAVLARSQHVVYAAGWVAAGLATVAVLLIPIDFTTRSILSLLLGPVVGLIVYTGYLVGASRLDRRDRSKAL